MELNKKYFGIFLLVIVAFSMLLNSCDVKNPTQGLEVRIKNIARTTYINASFKDAATGNLLTQDVSVTFSGNSKDKLISSTNEPITGIVAKQGIASFSLADDVVPSSSNPIKFNLICKANGYLNNSKPVQIFTTGTNSIEIIMTSPNNTPSGVTNNTENTGSANGGSGTSETISVSSGVESNSGASAAIELPAGTSLLDGNGNPLSGAVETSVTYFNPLTESSTEAFPGGFNVAVQNENGQMDDGGFVTAGFVAVDMNVGGTEVEGFSGGSLGIDIEIPEGTMNPTTGQAVKVGDVIPIYSYDEDNGEWKFEKNVTVTTLKAKRGKAFSTMAGKMGVSFSGISHLSYFNLDWFEAYTSTCYNGATLNLINTAGGCYDVKLVVIDNSTGRKASYWSTKYFKGVDSETLDIHNSVENKPVTVQVFDAFSDELLSETVIQNLCSNETIPVNFSQSSASAKLVTVNLNIKCDSQSDNPRALSPDGFPLWARKVTAQGAWNGSWFEVGSFQNGSLSKCMEVGAYYEFAVEYDGSWYYSLDYEDPFLIESDVINYSIIDDSRICDNL